MADDVPENDTEGGEDDETPTQSMEDVLNLLKPSLADNHEDWGVPQLYQRMLLNGDDDGEAKLTEVDSCTRLSSLTTPRT